MIDTIVLTLNHKQFSITEHSGFTPSTLGLYQAPYYRMGKKGFMKCVQNPTTEDLKNGVYKPRLTVTRRWGMGSYITTLRIEFSVPKLLFGNNFDEVAETDFNEVIKRLSARLNEMNVIVFPEMLRTAPVSAVHYSKNIILTDYSTPSGILTELSKIDLNQKLDLNQIDFRNEGHSLKFRANSFEVSLYDKRKDLQKAKTSDKRAIERDNALQMELFDQCKPKAPFEVLRMEIRLNQRVKIKQVLGKIKIPSDLTFATLFKKTVAQKALLLFFDEIKASYALLSYRPPNGREFIADFKINNPKAKIRKMLQVFAVKHLIDEMGAREFREATRPYGKHNWARLKNDLSTYRFPAGSNKILKPLEIALRKFQSVRMKEYQKSL